MGKTLLIVNPCSGKAKMKTELLNVVNILSADGSLVTVYPTKARGDATEFAAGVKENEYEKIVVCGGDGTLNEVITGIMRSGIQCTLGYIPSGTLNEWSSGLQISRSIKRAAEDITTGKKIRLDIGKFGDKYFSYTASFGAFTKTTYTVPQDIKNMFGHFAYLLEGVKDLETLCPYPMKITADGEVFEGEYLFGAVCNSTSIAGLMKLSPDAVDLCDGQFELMLVPVPKTPLQLQRTIRAIVYEEYETSNALIFRHVRHVTAESDGSIPWTLDGEYAPGVPKIEIGIEDNGIQMMI